MKNNYLGDFVVSPKSLGVRKNRKITVTTFFDQEKFGEAPPLGLFVISKLVSVSETFGSNGFNSFT